MVSHDESGQAERRCFLESGMVDNINKYAWSSHKAYFSKARKWDWLHKEYLLSLFSNNSRGNFSRYKQFVSKETPEEINRILAGKKVPVIKAITIAISVLKS